MGDPECICSINLATHAHSGEKAFMNILQKHLYACK